MTWGPMWCLLLRAGLSLAPKIRLDLGLLVMLTA